MKTSASAIKAELRELIEVQIEIFGQLSPLTPSELSKCRDRAKRIKLLGQELDQVETRVILDQRFGRVA